MGMNGSLAARFSLIWTPILCMSLGCPKPSSQPPAAVSDARPAASENPDLAAPKKDPEPAKPAAAIPSPADLGLGSPDGGATVAGEGAEKASEEADSSVRGDILAIDSNRKLSVIKDAEIELRCSRKKADEVACAVNLQAVVKRKNQEVKLCSETDELPGVDLDKLKFDSSKAEGEATVTLIDIPKRGGSLVSVETKVRGGTGTTQSVTDVAWYILELPQDDKGSPTWKQVLGYEASNSLNHEGEESGGLSMDSDVTLEQQSRSCYGFPDLLLRSTQTDTPAKGRSHERHGKTQHRWNGTEYVEATGKPGPECKKSDSACKKQEIFCDHECRPKDTSEYCGGCSHRCPGIGKQGAMISCKDPETHACDMVCSGGNFDVDGKMENGCEVKPPAAVYHTKESALDLGAKNCKDLESRVKFEGILISDNRVHTSPPIVGVDTSGSAPFFARLLATGGMFCRDDLELRIKSVGTLATDACYELEVTGGTAPQLLRFTGHDDKVLKVAAPAYRDGAKLLFEVRSRCPKQAMRLEFEVELHL